MEAYLKTKEINEIRGLLVRHGITKAVIYKQRENPAFVTCDPSGIWHITAQKDGSFKDWLIRFDTVISGFLEQQKI